MRRRSSDRARDGAAVGLLWISPWLVGFGLFMLLPILVSLWYSLTDYELLSPAEFVGLANYTDLAGDAVFWKTIRNTAIYASLWIPLQTVIALVVAAWLAPPGRLVGVFRTAIFLPSLVPIVAASLVWLWMFRDRQSPLNAAVALIPGAGAPPWLTDETWAMASMVLVGLWAVGQPVVIYMTAMQDVPETLYEAAQLDGMGKLGCFWHITLPMISPLILFNVIIGIITAWQVFAQPYIITEGEPNRATYFYTMYLYDVAFQFRRMGYASAMAWVQLLIILSLTAAVLAGSRGLVHERSL
ncbi:MAG: sugar ABC transporter permease [Planctomycetota bacterium]